MADTTYSLCAVYVGHDGYRLGEGTGVSFVDATPFGKKAYIAVRKHVNIILLSEKRPLREKLDTLNGQREITVLHVDDDPEFADLVAIYFEHEGERLEVVTETSTEAGLDRLGDRDAGGRTRNGRDDSRVGGLRSHRLGLSGDGDGDAGRRDPRGDPGRRGGAQAPPREPVQERGRTRWRHPRDRRSAPRGSTSWTTARDSRRTRRPHLRGGLLDEGATAGSVWRVSANWSSPTAGRSRRPTVRPAAPASRLPTPRSSDQPTCGCRRSYPYGSPADHRTRPRGADGVLVVCVRPLVFLIGGRRAVSRRRTVPRRRRTAAPVARRGRRGVDRRVLG